VSEQYKDKTIEGQGGIMFTASAERFYFSEAADGLFVIGADGAAVVSHGKKSIQAKRFTDSADAKEYAAYFPAGTAMALLSDSLLRHASIEGTKPVTPRNARFRIVPLNKALYDSMDLEVNRTTGAPVRIVTRRKVPLAAGVPAGPEWEIEHIMTISDFNDGPPPQAASYYAEKDRVLSVCLDKFSTYTHSGL
jgi:hypothetical protein